MIEVCLLGTGGTVPLPHRWLTSLLVRWNGNQLLVDCGEGTQIALHQAGYACKQIDTILLTHYHADHTAGLPGLLLTMAKAERTEPVTFYGPKGLSDLLQGVYTIARYLPFELRYIEYEEKRQFFEIDHLDIAAFGVRHSVPTYGYSFHFDRQPKFNAAAALASGLPKQFWGRLQKGENVEYEGKQYMAADFLGEKRRGIHFVYATDTRPTRDIQEMSEDADLLILEGMYGDPEKQEKAEGNRHMMMQEAAAIAAEAKAKELWFTHYSPTLKRPADHEEEIRQIFANAVMTSDGYKKDLAFRED